MFEVDNESYKIEYEGLHRLCLRCGRFGHYVKGCSEKPTDASSPVAGGDDHSGEKMLDKSLPEKDGPWVVVQKSRRARTLAMGGPVKQGRLFGDVGGLTGGGVGGTWRRLLHGSGSRFHLFA